MPIPETESFTKYLILFRKSNFLKFTQIHSPAMRNTIVLEMKPVEGGPTFTLSIFLREAIKDPLAATAIVAMLDAILDDDSQQVVIDPISFGILNLGSARVELHDLLLIQGGGALALARGWHSRLIIAYAFSKKYRTLDSQ